MRVRDFYKSMKPVLKDRVLFLKEAIILWGGYIDENRPYEHLMEHEVDSIYSADKGLCIILKTKEEPKVEQCPCMKEPSYHCGMKCSNCGREL